MPIMLLLTALIAFAFGHIHLHAAPDTSQCHPEQFETINQFLLEARSAANATLWGSLKDGTIFGQASAYKNYFELGDFQQVKAMYSAIDALFRNDTLISNFWYLCSIDERIPLPCASKAAAPAYADPSLAGYPLDPQKAFSGFVFCQKFFETVNETQEDRCAATTFEELKTRAFDAVLLFAQAHAFGSVAGLPSRRADHAVPGLHPRNQTAGAFALTAEQLWVLARLLKQQWAGHGEPRGPRPAIQRVQSATSFAAAAMEWLWLIDCGKLGNDSTPA